MLSPAVSLVAALVMLVVAFALLISTELGRQRMGALLLALALAPLWFAYTPLKAVFIWLGLMSLAGTVLVIGWGRRKRSGRAQSGSESVASELFDD